jgi:hypothetical protein
MKPFSGFHEAKVKPPATRKRAYIIGPPVCPVLRLLILDSLWKRRRQETVMADTRGLKLVGYIFASVTVAVTLAATAVVTISIP